MTTHADELRAALAWETGRTQPDDKNVFAWLWEAVQGDFNDDRTTGQIAFDAALSMIPLVDQLCDVRDLVANCRAIATSKEGEDTSWKWVALALTLIGFIPSLGSLIKGVLKIFFLFVRRHGLDRLVRAVDEAMTWVITYLRKREVSKLWRGLKVDEVFSWLAGEVRAVKGLIDTGTLLRAFDHGISVLRGLLGKVAELPGIGQRARATLQMVTQVRKGADAHIGRAVEPVQRVLDAIAHRLELETVVERSGILNTHNIHFRGALPEARAVTLMKQAEPLPPWLGKGREGKWAGLMPADGRRVVVAQRKIDPDYPDLSDTNIASFHKLSAVEIKGPAKLYRVTSPSNGAMGDCWVPEDVWHKIMASPDPKTAWRKHCAVWPDWNPNGQFVVLEVPPGHTLKAWRGPASSQKKLEHPDLQAHLEGGWDQVVIKSEPGQYDTMRYFMRGGGHGEKLHPPGLTREEWLKLSQSKRQAYTPIRERINHPHIKGPLNTEWSATDFDAQLQDAKIGLPELPGQITN